MGRRPVPTIDGRFFRGRRPVPTIDGRFFRVVSQKEKNNQNGNNEQKFKGNLIRFRKNEDYVKFMIYLIERKIKSKINKWK